MEITVWKELEMITLSGLDRHKLMAYQLNDMSSAFNLVVTKLMCHVLF